MKLDELDDNAGGPSGGPDIVTEDPRAVMEYLEDLETLIEEDHVQYARETLEGIYESIRMKMYVTRGQMRAVGNIDDGGQKRKSW
ncbi:MAG: hypothetical protein LN417_01945 [Candidatus Thermoplasmatota archaeon]|nr:hypothetical protein [Candidatus Thermoplasmatota archaeon]